MPRPARSGVLIYARDLSLMSQFYESVLGMRVLHADAEHRVLANADAQLLLHAIPPHIREGIVVDVPPKPREEQAIKPFFTVEDLAGAEQRVLAAGGCVLGPLWPGPGMRVRNVCDVEGNILHLRELSS